MPAFAGVSSRALRVKNLRKLLFPAMLARTIITVLMVSS
jgi:hypothetical protein